MYMCALWANSFGLIVPDITYKITLLCVPLTHDSYQTIFRPQDSLDARSVCFLAVWDNIRVLAPVVLANKNKSHFLRTYLIICNSLYTRAEWHQLNPFWGFDKWEGAYNVGDHLYMVLFFYALSTVHKSVHSIPVPQNKWWPVTI